MKPIAEDFEAIAAELKRIEAEKKPPVIMPEAAPDGNYTWAPAAGYMTDYDPA